MNEQLIRKLAREAGFSGWDSQSQMLVDFTELIVRECVKHITDQQDLVETNWQCKDGIHIVYSLKEHFGVSE